MDIKELVELITRNSEAKGFWEEGSPNFAEKVALIHAETSEALEEHRDGRGSYYEVDGKPEGVAVELVDVIIRSLDLLGHLESFGLAPVEVAEVIDKKMAYNAGRPYKHGKAY